MKLLAAYAHPADAITDCGGTLALHVARGDEVTILSMTHGGRIHPNIYVEEWRKANPEEAIVQLTRQEIIDVKRRELNARPASSALSGSSPWTTKMMVWLWSGRWSSTSPVSSPMQSRTSS